jgi:hypothetical protein
MAEPARSEINKMYEINHIVSYFAARVEALFEIELFAD